MTTTPIQQEGCVDTRAANRTRSIRLTQIVLASAAVIISVVILATGGDAFHSPLFLIGLSGVVVITAITMGVPWARLSRSAVVIVPTLDIVAIGAMSFDTDMRLGFLWAFPVIWIASYFSTADLVGALVLILGILLIAVPVYAESGVSLIRLVVVLVVISFIGISAHTTARQSAAFRRLLRRQALRLRRASARAAATERQTTELLNAVDIGIGRIGPSGEFLVINDTLATLYGMDKDDLTQPPRSIDYDDRVGFPIPEHDRPFARAARGEEFGDMLVWLFDTSGDWRALSVSCERLGSAATDDDGMVLIAHDVTAVIIAERERDRLNAMATHEMRHPLTAILGNTELSLDMDELSDKTRQRMEVIHASSERLVALISDFLAGDLGARSPAEEGEKRFDLGEVVRQSVESFAAAAARADITVETHLDHELPVVGDAFRVRQVIDNLVSNAIKYTAEGGRVTVSGRREGHSARVSVADTGIGMTPEDLARVFDPYFRAQDAKDKAPGTGLGMSISRDILQSHGGHLTMESRTGIGSVVTAELPIAVGDLDDPRVESDAVSPERSPR